MVFVWKDVVVVVFDGGKINCGWWWCGGDVFCFKRKDWLWIMKR